MYNSFTHNNIAPFAEILLMGISIVLVFLAEHLQELTLYIAFKVFYVNSSISQVKIAVKPYCNETDIILHACPYVGSDRSVFNF